MTAPDRIGSPCEYCQMPQAEDDDGYGHCWTCQNPNCKGLLGYIRGLERAPIARATPAAMTPEVWALVEAAAKTRAAQKAYFRDRTRENLIASKQAEAELDAALAALRAGGDG